MSDGASPPSDGKRSDEPPLAEGFRALRDEQAPAAARERTLAALGLDARSSPSRTGGARAPLGIAVFLRWVLWGFAAGLLLFVLLRR